MRPQNIPSAKTAQDALTAAQAAINDLIVLEQRNPVNLEFAEHAQARNPDSNILELARDLESRRRAFNAALRESSQTKQAEAKRLSDAYAMALFNVRIPGPVTLPLEGKSHDVTYQVDGLTSVHIDDAGTSGYVAVSSHNGRARSTERFFTRDGKLQFAGPDLY